MKTLLAAGALALALAAPQASAQSGAPPLDPVLEGQLERWLGAGDQIFDNIYTRQGAGDDALDFHAAADERGPTFTLVRVSDRGGPSLAGRRLQPAELVDSDDGWHFTQRDFQRTAFIFNYTEPAVYRQVPSSFELPSQGSFQTFNAIDQGPTFGAGPDLFVDEPARHRAVLAPELWRPGRGRAQHHRRLGRRTLLCRSMPLEVYAVSPIPEPARRPAAGRRPRPGGAGRARAGSAAAAAHGLQPAMARRQRRLSWLPWPLTRASALCGFAARLRRCALPARVTRPPPRRWAASEARHLAIVINDDDPDSVAVGAYYRRRRAHPRRERRPRAHPGPAARARRRRAFAGSRPEIDSRLGPAGQAVADGLDRALQGRLPRDHRRLYPGLRRRPVPRYLRRRTAQQLLQRAVRPLSRARHAPVDAAADRIAQDARR